MTIKSFIKMFLFLFLFTSCFPYRYALTPSFEGKVVDKKTNQAITNASIILYCESRNKKKKTTTDKNGIFSLPAIKEWGVYFIAQEPLWLNGKLCIKSINYTDVTEKYIHQYNGYTNKTILQIKNNSNLFGVDHDLDVLIKLNRIYNERTLKPSK